MRNVSSGSSLSVPSAPGNSSGYSHTHLLIGSHTENTIMPSSPLATKLPTHHHPCTTTNSDSATTNHPIPSLETSVSSPSSPPPMNSDHIGTPTSQSPSSATPTSTYIPPSQPFAPLSTRIRKPNKKYYIHNL